MSKRRRAAWINRIKVDGAFCVYCGALADSRDHWPPLAVTGTGKPGWTLPACRECNLLAGDYSPERFLDRAAHVKERLRKRYRKVLRPVRWKPSELAGLGPAMRESVEMHIQHRKLIEARLAWNVAAYIRGFELL